MSKHAHKTASGRWRLVLAGATAVSALLVPSLAAAAAVRCSRLVGRRVCFWLQRLLRLLIQTPRSPKYAGPASIFT